VLFASKYFQEVSLTKKGALVIGGGVAGIQAALDLADADFQVYLVERSSTLGGRMAQIDKTFPSMDCAI
jgi:heterodisulfide reductase subunit A